MMSTSVGKEKMHTSVVFPGLPDYKDFAKNKDLRWSEITIPDYRSSCKGCNCADLDYLWEVWQRRNIAQKASSASAKHLFYCTHPVLCEMEQRLAGNEDIFTDRCEYGAVMAEASSASSVEFYYQGTAAGIVLGDEACFKSFQRFIEKSIRGELDISRMACCVCFETEGHKLSCVTCNNTVCKQCWKRCGINTSGTCPVCRGVFCGFKPASS
jgi:hypothetical protein